ncbi:MAG: hypothetical protein ABSF93_01760 [Candidatus Sulfotelmatobacter sp.]
MVARYAHMYSGLLVQLAVVLGVCLVAWWVPTIGNSWFQILENFGSRIARRKLLAIGVIFVATIGVRLSLLPLLGVPLPSGHDDYSYLLMGDTFAHGRLANPTHPEWPSFETFHVLSHPTYSSIFPPAQGLALAIGEVAGSPWIGVLLSVSAMCSAIVWMLQGWMPARWALLGGVLAMLNLGIVSYWMNSYWGGAMAATGGALVLGALARMRQLQSVGGSLLMGGLIMTSLIMTSLIMGLGIAILANSRPLEGFIFCLPVAGALLIWLSGKRSPPLRATARCVVAPLAAVLLMTIAFMGYYNWRVTGHPLLLPHSLYLHRYYSPIFLWERLKAPVHYGNRQFEDFYNGWIADTYRGTARDVLRMSWEKVRGLPAAFLWTGSLPVLLLLPWVFRDSKIRLLVVELVTCGAGLFLVVYSNPHYAAPLTCVIYALVVQGIRHLRTIRWKGRAVGIAWSRAAIVLLVAVTASNLHHVVRDPDHPYPWSWDRGRGSDACGRVEQQLADQPGKQLIVVRYAASHNPHGEWVYNLADIDGAKIVWARELGTQQDEKLLSYFKDRKAWLFEPDRDATHLKPYPQESPLTR